ncbi:unnamed protein product, partial [Meganyctiphanes norvegica]
MIPKTHAWNGQDNGECNYTLRTLKISVNGVQQLLTLYTQCARDRQEDSEKKFGIPGGGYRNVFLIAYEQIYKKYITLSAPQNAKICSMQNREGTRVRSEKHREMNLKEDQNLIDITRRNRNVLIKRRYFLIEYFINVNSNKISDISNNLGVILQEVYHFRKKFPGRKYFFPTLAYTLQSSIFESRLNDCAVKVMMSSHNGVDETTSATLVYPGGRVATLNCSMRCLLPCEGIVVGTKGTIKVNYPMWCPESLESPSGKFESPLPINERSFNFNNSQGMMYEAAEVRRCLKEGLLESPLVSLDETLLMAELMEDIRKQVGVVYDQD